MKLSVPPCLRGKVPMGFTLIEILAALAVLAVGLAAVVGLFLGSVQHGQLASDRNAAATLIPEAIRAIEKEHLITDFSDPNFGEFIQTLSNALINDTTSGYANVQANGKTLTLLDDSLPPATVRPNLNEWPRRPAGPLLVGGMPYRVRYRLERHPPPLPISTDTPDPEGWWPHGLDGTGDGDSTNERINSPYRGVYVLTVVCYKDAEQDMSKPVQVSDPVVTYLRDRKQR